MATGDTEPTLASSSPPPPLLENSPSNLSSPLSEVEDRDADAEEVDLDMRDDSHAHGTPNRSGAAEGPDSDAASESDDESKLSELDVNDSEAETERLYDTPPKNGAPRDIVNAPGDAGHRRFTDRRARVFDRSPSKLHQQLDADDPTSGRNSASDGEEEDDEDDVSMASSEPRPDTIKGSEPRSPMLVKKGQVVQSTDKAASQLVREDSVESRKRKRPSLSDHSESEQPLKKRTSSVGAADRDLSADDTAMIDDGGVSTNAPSGDHTAEEDEHEEPMATMEAKGDALPEQAQEEITAPSRSKKGKRSPTKKRKSKSPEGADAQEEAPDEPPEDAGAQILEVPTPHAEENHAEEIDEEAEAAHRNEEECTRTATPLFEMRLR